MMRYRYPCTKHISMNGFGEFLEKESVHSRRNLNAFADELKEQFGVSYLTLVNSGSSANLVAALVLAEKLKNESKPLCAAVSAFTFPTTISSLILAGFDVQIVDVDEGEFNISLDEIKKIDPFPSVLAVTHFLGFPCAIREITEHAHRMGSYVLQDCCETLGMTVGQKQVFRYGDISTWSFYHPHHLSAYGGGGVITLNRDDYILADSIAHWGRGCKCHIDESLCKIPAGPAHQFTYERLGINVEMSELNACFGRWQLQEWKEIEEKRLRHYDILYHELKDVDHIHVWRHPEIESSVFVFPVQLKNGWTVNDIYPFFQQEGIEIRTLMGGCANEQEAYKEQLGTELQRNAHEMARTSFFVGIHQTLDDEDVKYVAKKLREIVLRYLPARISESV